METASPSADRVLLLGPFQIIRNGGQLLLPRSRKARALLAYLVLAPRPVTREKLCELFWDVADDPKSELRWCLSKLRPLVDGPAATRLIADRERVRIDTSSLDIDAISLARNAQTTLSSASRRSRRCRHRAVVSSASTSAVPGRSLTSRRPMSRNVPRGIWSGKRFFTAPRASARRPGWPATAGSPARSPLSPNSAAGP